MLSVVRLYMARARTLLQHNHHTSWAIMDRIKTSYTHDRRSSAVKLVTDETILRYATFVGGLLLGFHRRITKVSLTYTPQPPPPPSSRWISTPYR